MLKWMIDEEYSSGSIFSKLILTKFDKIKFQKSWHQTLMLTQSRWERSIIPWKTRYFSFFFTPKDAWQSFYLIETWKFLEFTQGSLQERSSLPLTPHSRIASPHLLPPIVPWRLALRQHLLTRGCRTHRMMSRIASSALSSIPKPRSKEIPVSRQSLHLSPHSSRLPMSRP